MIELKDICFAYDGEPVLRHLNLRVPKGKTVVLQGPNGCGKSTLLKIVNGLEFPEEGSYLFAGKEINEKTLKDSRFSKWFHQKMGFVFQNADVQLFCGNVEEEIQFGPLQMGLSREEVQKRTEDVIQLLEIGKLRKKAPYHLSGGEKRKVAIACILSMNPEVLVLDEPLAGLDNHTQKWLLDFLKSLKSAGKTMLLSTHNEHLANEMADYFAEISDQHELVEVRENKTIEEQGQS